MERPTVKQVMESLMSIYPHMVDEKTNVTLYRVDSGDIDDVCRMNKADPDYKHRKMMTILGAIKVAGDFPVNETYFTQYASGYCRYSISFHFKSEDIPEDEWNAITSW